MSTLRSSARAATGGRTRRICLYAAVIVLLWSLMEVVSLSIRHTNGAELYGVLVAGLAVAAGAASVGLLISPRPRTWATVAVLVVWIVIALGGLAGVAAHVIFPVSGPAAVDLRSRPVLAPLIFTTLALVGGGALFIGQRSNRREPTQEGD